MMVLFRSAALWLLLAFLACAALERLTGDAIWRQRGRQVLKWGVVMGMVFLGVLALRRGAVFI